MLGHSLEEFGFRLEVKCLCWRFSGRSNCSRYILCVHRIWELWWECIGFLASLFTEVELINFVAEIDLLISGMCTNSEINWQPSTTYEFGATNFFNFFLARYNAHSAI